MAGLEPTFKSEPGTGNIDPKTGEVIEEKKEKGVDPDE